MNVLNRMNQQREANKSLELKRDRSGQQLRVESSGRVPQNKMKGSNASAAGASAVTEVAGNLSMKRKSAKNKGRRSAADRTRKLPPQATNYLSDVVLINEAPSKDGNEKGISVERKLSLPSIRRKSSTSTRAYAAGNCSDVVFEHADVKKTSKKSRYLRALNLKKSRSLEPTSTDPPSDMDVDAKFKLFTAWRRHRQAMEREASELNHQENKRNRNEKRLKAHKLRKTKSLQSRNKGSFSEEDLAPELRDALNKMSMKTSKRCARDLSAKEVKSVALVTSPSNSPLTAEDEKDQSVIDEEKHVGIHCWITCCAEQLVDCGCGPKQQLIATSAGHKTV